MTTNRWLQIRIALLSALALAAAILPAAEPAGKPGTPGKNQTSAKPGINDSYRTIKIEQAVKRFEGTDREVVKKKDDILAACQLKPGMAVADLGAGTGLFTRLFSAKVGPEGKVYAVDITPSFIDHIKEICKAEGLRNVETVLSKDTSAELPKDSVELVFLCDTYHHFEHPAKMLASIRESLRGGGKFVVIDRKKADDHVRAGQETVVKEIAAAGFKLIDQQDLGKTEYLLRFER